MVGASHISDWRVDYNVLGHYIIDTNLVTSGKRFTISYVEATSGNKDIINNAGNAQFISNNKMKSYPMLEIQYSFPS
jgi:hypothetical protein